MKIKNGAFVPVYDDGGAKPWVCFDGHKPDVWAAPVNVSFAGTPPSTYAEAQKRRAGIATTRDGVARRGVPRRAARRG